MTCNRDCFNCQYDDCILSETADINEQKAEWIKNNPEKRQLIRRRYYISHCQSEKSYQQQYRANNIEDVRRKDRERKAKKKAERVS